MKRQCRICRKTFTTSQKRVVDHCHLTGKVRGAAHEDCNLNFKDARYIPVVFHNFSQYDAHFIIREVAKHSQRLSVIPLTAEKYISLTQYIPNCKTNLRYIDSYRFMASSLEKLVSYLTDYPITRKVMSHLSDEQFSALTRKGVFCDEYVTSMDKLEDTCLPPKKAFYSHLTGAGISDSDYAYAQHVWTLFNLKTLGEYADLYLKLDCILLADVFLNFRKICFEAYELDPAHYYTSPGLSWDAMLKSTGQTLELLTDPDQYLFIEKGIRGGLSQCSNRYARAYNRYTSDYTSGDCNYLMYFDFNSLYGFAMSEPLPFKGFHWIDSTSEEWKEAAENAEEGYILEVDLEYPRECHDLHKDLPFCAELAIPPKSKQNKLLATLHPKKNYLIHYRNLQQAIANGLKVTRVHRILAFQQKAWLKPYIEKNTNYRKAAPNDFDKNFFKLQINSIFGKTMESVRKYVDIKLATHWGKRYGAEAYIAKPNFHSLTIFGEELVAIKLSKTDIALNKPIYAGFSVLDISKTCVYDFHYKKMYTMFEPSSVKLLYTDTDSLVYDIRHPNVYEVMKAHLDYFDTSSYSENNIFGLQRVGKREIVRMKIMDKS